MADPQRRTKTATISMRLDPDLKRQVEEVAAAHPYKPSITNIIERGMVLAMAEMREQSAKQD